MSNVEQGVLSHTEIAYPPVFKKPGTLVVGVREPGFDQKFLSNIPDRVILSGLGSYLTEGPAIATEDILASIRPEALEQFGIYQAPTELPILLAAALVAPSKDSHIGIAQTPKDLNALLWTKWRTDQSMQNIIAASSFPVTSTELGVEHHAQTIFSAGLVNGSHQAIGKGWIPSSNLWIANEALRQIPTSPSNPNVQRLLTSVATSQYAHEHGEQVLSIRVGPTINPTYDINDPLLKAYAQLTHTGGLGAPEKLTPDTLKALNNEFGSRLGIILPSAQMLCDHSVIDWTKIDKIRRDLSSQSWHGVTLPNQEKLEDIQEQTPYIDDIIPTWDPKSLIPLLQNQRSFVTEIKDPDTDTIDILKSQAYRAGKSTRPTYNVATDLPSAFRDQKNLGYYNNPHGPDMRPNNLWTDEFEGLRQTVYDYIKRSGNFVMVVPFVGEKESLKRVLEYGREILGPGRVIAANHQRSKESEKIARDTGVVVSNANDTLSRIDWQRLVKDGIIPPSPYEPGCSFPSATKGMNLLNGFIRLWDMEQNGEINDETVVVLTDADIMNVPSQEVLKNGIYRIDEHYDPLLNLGLMVRDSEQKGLKLEGFMHAKTGEGRNNQLSHFASDKIWGDESEYLHNMGAILSAIVWPHTESRAYKWKLIKKMIGRFNMEIEQAFNFAAAAESLKQGRLILSQIAVPQSKIECDPSPDDREWAMMTNIALGHDRMRSMLRRTQKPLDEWGLEQVKLNNQHHAGRPYVQSVTLNRHPVPRQSQVSIADTLMASLNTLSAEGYFR